KAITVLVTEHAGFGERTVFDLNRRLAGLPMLERRVSMPVLVIVQGRVALAECAAGGVLTRDANPVPLATKTCKRKRFTGGPIQRLLPPRHLQSGFEPLLDFWV